jgi:hypothetical protein
MNVRRSVSARRALASIVLFSLCFSGSLLLSRTTKPESSCTSNNALPGWHTFTDRVHRFCFQYPPLYRSQKPAPKRYLRPGSKLLLFLANGERPEFTKDGRWLAASISVIFSTEAFDLERIVTYAPNGVIKLDPVQVGSYTFYYWGPGGGGVEYPDDYFFNLHGRTLWLGFDGPYTERSKSPDGTTRQIEKKVLASFRTF